MSVVWRVTQFILPGGHRMPEHLLVTDVPSESVGTITRCRGSGTIVVEHHPPRPEQKLFPPTITLISKSGRVHSSLRILQTDSVANSVHLQFRSASGNGWLPTTSGSESVQFVVVLSVATHLVSPTVWRSAWFRITNKGTQRYGRPRRSIGPELVGAAVSRGLSVSRRPCQEPGLW